MGVFRFRNPSPLRHPVLPLGGIAGPAPSSPPLHPRRLSGSCCLPRVLPRASAARPGVPALLVPPGPWLAGLWVSRAWARAPVARPASLPTRPRPASAAQGLRAWPLSLPPTSAPPPPQELLFLVNPPRAATGSARSSQPRAPPSRAPPRAVAAAAAARPAHRAARTEPAPPRPPPSPRSPPQAPDAAGKSLLAEQRRSPRQLSIPPLLLSRHSLLRERWLFGEGGEVRGSPARGEGGRDSLSRRGRR